ncbi:hypothetical protein M8C21_000182, partial [Ambrosia artemisiifolia]
REREGSYKKNRERGETKSKIQQLNNSSSHSLILKPWFLPPPLRTSMWLVVLCDDRRSIVFQPISQNLKGNVSKSKSYKLPASPSVASPNFAPPDDAVICGLYMKMGNITKIDKATTITTVIAITIPFFGCLLGFFGAFCIDTNKLLCNSYFPSMSKIVGTLVPKSKYVELTLNFWV